MRICQICQEPIWEDRFHVEGKRKINKFVCFYCFSHLKDGDYKPTIAKSVNFQICEKCGEVSESVKDTEDGCFCEDCRE